VRWREQSSASEAFLSASEYDGKGRRAGMSLIAYDWERNGVTVLHLSGQLTLGDGTSSFRKLIRETLDQGKKNIILKMSEVYYIDSSGLGELVTAFTTVSKQGGKLKLLKLTQRVQDLVQLTKVYRVLEVFTDEDAAINSFAEGSASA
jgi:anti-sigma B factor antagonist